MNIRYYFILFFLCLAHVNLHAMFVIPDNRPDAASENLLTEFKQMRLYHLYNPTMKALLQTTLIYSYLQAHHLFNKYNKEKDDDTNMKIVLKNIFENARYEIDGALHNLLGDFPDRMNYICNNHNERLEKANSSPVTFYKKGNFTNGTIANKVGRT